MISCHQLHALVSMSIDLCVCVCVFLMALRHCVGANLSDIILSHFDSGDN